MLGTVLDTTHAVVLYLTARAMWPSFRNAVGETFAWCVYWERVRRDGGDKIPLQAQELSSLPLHPQGWPGAWHRGERPEVFVE